MTSDVPDLVRRLADRLGAAAPGETVTWTQLSNAIGQDIKRSRYLVYAAFRVLEKEVGAKFATEYKVGYRRLKSDELVKIGQTARKAIRNTGRRAIRGMNAGIRVANDLSPAALREVLREQSTLGLVVVVTQDRHLPVIDETETRMLTPGQAARQFLDAIGGLPKPPKPE